MVNLVSPPSLSQMQFWHGLWEYQHEPRLERRARQRLLARRDRQTGLQWVWASNGQVPRNAVRTVDSHRNSSFIGRAHHQGSVTPGYIDPKRKACCIAWGGDEHEKRIYEVLCTTGSFLPVSEVNTEVLLSATSAGISENGEPLFIGRVRHEGKYIYGKVQRSHGVCYISHGKREMGFKEYEVFSAMPDPTFQYHEWVSNEDVETVPPKAIVGGMNQDGYLYIGRAKHRNSLTPGSVCPRANICHIAWGSDEHPKSKYEYLCNCKTKFISCSSNNVPVGAIHGGYSEFGEPLFIGRVQINRRQLIVGKVQPSHSVCYVPYRGKETAYKEYEILVLDNC
ncbi:uncharacterized protein LOC129749618 [Uranotaenia lowii]|uniref:uncharacterized protein LOC129749618 n=1 Tax=Uranotaenia lowii TaxID=190385 RepID=UPI00247A7039|nr:uncharacterized protein LOC129749618 [Uranotaenia lowii]